MKCFCFIFIFSCLCFISCKNKTPDGLKIENHIHHLLLSGNDKSLDLNNRLIFIDSAYASVIKTSSIDSLELAIISTKSLLHFEKKQHDSFLFYNRLLIKKSKTLKDDYFLGKGHFNIAYYFDDLEYIPDSAFYHYNKSKNYFIRIEDSMQVGKKLLNMAILQNIQNDFFGAKETLTEALQYLDTIHSKKYVASVFSELATNNVDLENYSDAINYYEKAINTSNSKNDIISYKNNLALAYTESKRYSESITLLKELLLDSLVTENSARYARILHNLTYSKWCNGGTGLKDSFFKALKIRKGTNDRRGQIASYLDLGKYYSKTNGLMAKKYLDTLIQLSQELKIPRAETNALQILMALEPNNSIFKDRYIFLKDSLYKNELTVKTQFAKMKYDDGQKQTAITNLTLDKELKALEIAKQKNQKTIFILLGIIIIISAFFIIYYLKQHHKKDKLKEVYTTETRISQKVHDELANDVYNVMNRIQNKTGTQQKDVLNQLENIYKKTRDISYENGAINPDINYYCSELKEMLNTYQNENIRISTIGLSVSLFENIKDHQKIVMERVLKELMTNMKKHSKASNVVITFQKNKKTMYLTYADDGVGFKKTSHFKNNGLQNAENRIKNINGSFNFDATKEKGVSIKMAFPV